MLYATIVYFEINICFFCLFKNYSYIIVTKKKKKIVWKLTCYIYFIVTFEYDLFKFCYSERAYPTRRFENGWWESEGQWQNGLRKSYRWVNRQNNTQYRRTKTKATSWPAGLYRFRADRKAYHLVYQLHHERKTYGDICRFRNLRKDCLQRFRKHDKRLKPYRNIFFNGL